MPKWCDACSQLIDWAPEQEDGTSIGDCGCQWHYFDSDTKEHRASTRFFW